jgi:murein DD-endopeptidase MepM/ murein hydrolase activator NlpD
MRRLTPALVALLLLTGCALPRWPVDGTVSSPFGLRRDGLRLDIHKGVDIRADAGTPVVAMAPGRVAFAGTMSGYGRVVMVDHRGGVRTIYAHLAELRVDRGQAVDGRTVVGIVGMTGRTTGPHLHFEIRRGDRPEDPVPLLGGHPAPRRE